VDKRKVIFKDLGIIEYKAAWDYQEELLQENVAIKSALRKAPEMAGIDDPQGPAGGQRTTDNGQLKTQNYFLFCEHPPVYTLGKSGNASNVLMSDAELEENNIQFFNTNRGGDITFHGLQQVVGYPILDLENFYTDIGKYLRNL
jgi:lipoyl(octanoyl) transferase